MNRSIYFNILLAVFLGLWSEMETAFLLKAPSTPNTDLISLHYDHAPDRDDEHSAVADRMILQEKFGTDWLNDHTIAVSGAYGVNGDQFQAESDAVMDAVWNDCCGWIAAHGQWDSAVDKLYDIWTSAIASGGEVWVKEGGQPDITADVIRRVKAQDSNINVNQLIHVVQHSDWNEDRTTEKDLNYVKISK
jgi:hypothetical protein